MSDFLPWFVLCASPCAPACFGKGFWRGSVPLSPNTCYSVHLLQLLTTTTAVLKRFLKGKPIIASGEMEVKRAESSMTRSPGWQMKAGDRNSRPETKSSV